MNPGALRLVGRHPYFIEFRDLRTDSEFFCVLSDATRSDDIASQVAGVMTRATIGPPSNASRYLAEVSATKYRKEMPRQEKRLSEQGTFTYDELPAAANPSHSLEDFIALKATGWKGRNSTAFGSSPEYRARLLEVAKAAAARGRLMILALRLDGRPIAMKLNVLAGKGSHAFKIAFDERVPEVRARHVAGTGERPAPSCSCGVPSDEWISSRSRSIC